MSNDCIEFKEYTFARCLEFWRSYVADFDMLDSAYVYDPQWVLAYYRQKVLAPDRVFFAVVFDDVTIGEIQLKNIDNEARCATLSFHICNDSYKNRGFGTTAEKLLLKYAFEVLNLKTVYADCVLRNTRSQHVLEKAGFVFTHEDAKFKYYSANAPTDLEKKP